MRLVSVVLSLFFALNVRSALGCLATTPGTMPQATTTVATTTTKKADNQNCRTCDPLLIRVVMGGVAPSKNIDRDELGNDAVDGCRTRTFSCNGLEDPIHTELLWNNANAGVSRDTPELVVRTLRCNNKAQWILPEHNMETPITQVECVATSLEA